MAEEVSFKFSLDLSDFDKAPKVIDDALQTISEHAKIQGKDTDLAMAGYLDSLIKERQNAVEALQKESEKVYVKWAELRAQAKSGLVSNEEVDKVGAEWNKLMDTLDQTRNELDLLQEKENELAGNRSFMTSVKAKAQSLDLYGKAMQMLPAPIAQVIQSSKMLNGALKALLANPVVLTITAVVLAVKLLGEVLGGLIGYFDRLADRSDGVAYVFGLITGVVSKMASAIEELMMLNLDGFLYNIKTMFDGGEREVAKRNEDLRKAEEAGLRDRLQRDNQFLRRRINNTKLDMKERLEAEKQYTENLKKIEETRRAELQRKMTEWSKKNGWKTDENPNGWATSKGQLSGPLQVELQEMENEMARIDNALADIDLESGDRKTKLYDQVHDLFEKNLQDMQNMVQKRKEYQRSVSEQLEQEKQRLQALSQETENQAIKAQIDKMVDGIEKTTAQAKQKVKESMQSLDKALYDEAKQLYENEKKIFEGNPDNEGKMFKRFNYLQYVQQAKKNIGYDIKKGLISDEELETIKKAVDEIVKKALEGAKKVSEEVGSIVGQLQQATGNEASSFAESYETYTTGIQDAIDAHDSYKRITDDIADVEKNLMNLQLKRTSIVMELNHTEDPEKRLKLAEQLESTESDINNIKNKGVALLEKQKDANEKMQKSYSKIKQNANAFLGIMESSLSSLKGINKNIDETVESLSQMMEMGQNLLSGDIMGAMTQVATFIANKLTEAIKARKQMQEERLKNEKEQAKQEIEIQNALKESALDYKLALIDAKYAQDDLYDTTNIQKMIDAQSKLTDLQEQYKAYTENVYTQYGRNGQKTSYSLNQFVNSMVDKNAVISGTGSKDDPYQYKKKNDIIKDYFGEYLFKKNQDGDYELNTNLWKQLKENQKASDYFNETQINAIENIYAWQEKIADAQKELAEGIADWYSPILDNMTDAMMDWLTTNESIMDKFKDYSADTFRSIVKDMLKNMLYKDLFKKYTEDIATLTETYVNDGNQSNYAEAIATTTNKLMKDMEGAKDTYKQVWDAWKSEMKKIGIDMNDTDSSSGSAQARGIARASQESVDENNARLAMMQQHTYSINANVSQLVATSSLMLQHLQGIHTNTNELSRLAKIESTLSDIQTYGIKTR